MHLCALLAEQVNSVFRFGLLRMRKFNSKAVYQIDNRNLKLAFDTPQIISVNLIAWARHKSWLLSFRV